VTAAEALRALRERWWVLVAATVLAGIGAYIYLALPWVEPRWRSSVLLQASGRLDYGNILALEKELRPLTEQVLQLSIMREVDRNLHTDLGPERMLERTKAEPVQDSGQMRIDVEDSDPERAERLSLEIADVYTRQHNAEAQGKLREERIILSTLDRPNRATLIWPLTRTIVPAAALLGLFAAMAVVLVLTYLDDSLGSAAEVEGQLGLRVLGRIPREHRATSQVARRVPQRVTAVPESSAVSAGRKDPNVAT
jgi:capsular polysaccharide biosynthesis protein